MSLLYGYYGYYTTLKNVRMFLKVRNNEKVLFFLECTTNVLQDFIRTLYIRHTFFGNKYINILMWLIRTVCGPYCNKNT